MPATLVAELAAPLAGPRTPSTRPLDRRWDRSRGIVLSDTSRRPVVKDCTWSSAKGVVFAETAATSRRYASRSLASSINTADAAPTAAAANTKFSNQGPLDKRPATGSVQAVEKLRQEIRDLKKVIGKLEMEIKKHEDTIKDRETAHTKKDEHMRQLVTEKENQAAKKSESMQEQYAQTLKEKDRQISDLKASVKNVQYDLAQFKTKSSPQYTDNQTILDAARAEGADAGTKALQPRIDELTRLLKDSVSRETGYRKRIANLEADGAAHQKSMDGKLHDVQAQLHMEKGRVADQYSRNSDLQAQLNGRTRRQEHERAIYSSYRSLHDDLVHEVLGVGQELEESVQSFEYQAVMWERAAQAFNNSKHLTLFREKYPDLNASITRFLENHQARDSTKAASLQSTANELTGWVHEFRNAAHLSRELTRYHRFDDVQTLYRTAGVLENAVTARPLRDARDMTMLQNAGQRSEDLDDVTKVLRILVVMADRIRALEQYKALLYDSYVEKEVFLHCAEGRNIMESFVDGIDEFYDHTEGKDRRKMFNRHRQDARERKRLAENELGEFEVHARKLHTLRYEVDGVSKSRQLEIDNKIRERIDTALHEVQNVAKRLAVKTSRVQRLVISHAAPIRRLTAPASIKVEVPSRSAVAQPREDAKTSAALLIHVKSTCAGNERKLLELRAAEPRDELAILHAEKGVAALKQQILTIESGESVPLTRRERAIASRSTALTSLSRSKSNVDKASKMPAVASAALGPTTGFFRFKPTEARQAQQQPIWVFAARDVHTDTGFDEIDHSFLSLPGGTPTPQSLSTSSEAISTGSGNVIGCEEESSTRSSPDSPAFQSIEDGRQATAGMMQDLARDPSSDSTFEQDSSVDSASTGGEFDVVEVVQDIPSSTPVEQSSSAGSESEGDDASVDAEMEEPQTILEYKISPKELRQAYSNSATSHGSYWSYKMYKNAEGRIPKVHYCTNFEQSQEQAQHFLSEGVLGFDLEWESSATKLSATTHRKRYVSLVQIASQDRIGLFQIGTFTGESVEELMPPALRQILESPDIVKVGVNVRNDANRLRDCFGVHMQGLFELSQLYKVVNFSAKEPSKVNFVLVNMALQVAEVLLLPLKKDKDVRVGHWSRKLDAQQIEYAACDAYAGLQLYHRLDNKRKLMKPTPPRPAYQELNRPLVLGDGTIIRKGASRSRAVPKKATGAAAEEEDPDDEEFFDAMENPADDSEALVAAMSALDVADVRTSDSVEVTYSTLPVQDFTEQAVGGAGMSADEGPAQALPAANTSAAAMQNSTAEQAAVPTTQNQRPTSPEYAAATAWATAWRSEHPPPSAGSSKTKSHATPSILRAYHLWHFQGYDLAKVANCCRDPPLAFVTVASYVLEALRLESLPYEVERVREPLAVMPSSVHGRYRTITERLGES